MIATDYALIALWLALFIRNKAAIFPLLILCVDLFLYSVAVSDIHRIVISAAFCFLISAYAHCPNYLRAPFLATGAICWVGALDELLYIYIGISTVYYSVMPYLIIAINAYIAAVLFDKGCFNHAEFTKRHPRLVNRRWLGL